MPNFFDQFDSTAPTAGAPPPQVSAPPPVAPTGGNYFDQFDAPPPSMWEAIRRGAGQGLSFNFGDEVSAAAEASGLPSWAPGREIAGGARLLAEHVAPGTFGTSATEAYNTAVARERAADAAARDAHPLAYFGGEVGGSLATLPFAPELAPFKVAQEAGLLARGGARVGNLAATGGAYGAAAGAGAGEGNILDRAGPAASGAAVGAVAAPVIGGIIGGAGAAGRYVADNVTALRNPRQLAERMVARNLQRDAADVPALADDIARARAAGQDLTLADIAGPNTQSVAGTIARTPGEGRTAARDFLDSRIVGNDAVPGQNERVTDQLGRLLGDKGAIDTADTIMARRKADADKLYEAAYRRPLDYSSPDGGELLSLLQRVPNETKAAANKILTISDRDGHQLIWDTLPDPKGNYPLIAVPNGRQWQYIKEGLDTTIAANRNPVTGELNTLGGAVQGLKTQILSKLDALNPVYRQARQTYAGDSELLDALRAGQDAFKRSTTTEAVGKTMRDLTSGEAAMYRLGASNALRNDLSHLPDGSDITKAAFGRPSYREKIASMAQADPAGHADFVRYMRNEGAMFGTRQRATGNSTTAEKLTDDAEAFRTVAEGAHAAISLAHGRFGPALRTVWGHLSKVDPELRGSVMNEARKVVLNPDPDAVRAFGARLQAAPLKDGTRQRVWAAVQQALPRAVTSQSVGAQ